MDTSGLGQDPDHLVRLAEQVRAQGEELTALRARWARVAGATRWSSRAGTVAEQVAAQEAHGVARAERLLDEAAEALRDHATHVRAHVEELEHAADALAGVVAPGLRVVRRLR